MRVVCAVYAAMSHKYIQCTHAHLRGRLGMACRLTLGMRADRDRPPGVMNKLHRKEVDPVIPPRAFPPIQKLVDILGEQGHENDLLPALLALEDVSQVLADVLRVVHNPAYTACYMSKESRAQLLRKSCRDWERHRARCWYYL